ncbi:MAG: cell division ATP-binding protein FtsE [Dongiaceae bacterium]
MHQPIIVRAENLTIAFGPVAVVKQVNFTLKQGEFYFLTGQSGAGKSSLLRLLYLAGRPSSGELEVFGERISTLPRSQWPKLRRRMGVVFQDFRLLGHLTVLDNVALPLRIGGANKKQIEDHVRELLDWVGLGDRLHAYPYTLSGGEQQRVAIARAVITKPALLLADEPTGNVDDAMAMRLMYLFEELNKMGTTVIIATHNENLIKRFSYSTLHLQEGKLALDKVAA